MGPTGSKSDPKNDGKKCQNPIPGSPWPPVRPRGHLFGILAPFWHHFCANLGGAQRPPDLQNTSQMDPECHRLPVYSDPVLFPGVPEPGVLGVLAICKILRSMSPGRGAGGRGRQPLRSAAPACGSRGVFRILQQSFVSQPSDIQSLKEFSLPVGPASGAGPCREVLSF